MALSVAQGFETFLSGLVPLESQRTAAARHRASVEVSLRGALDVSLFRETGSFSHGTGVRGHCDVDLLVSIKGQRPGSSDTALAWVTNALAASFPYTPVRISRPALSSRSPAATRPGKSSRGSSPAAVAKRLHLRHPRRRNRLARRGALGAPGIRQ